MDVKYPATVPYVERLAAMADPKPTPLRGWPIQSLRYELRKQLAPGVSTWGVGICGHNARGGGYCAECLRAEIGRREDGR